MRVEKINEDLYFIILNSEKIGTVEKKFERYYLIFFGVFVSSYEKIDINPLEIKKLIISILSSFLKHPEFQANGDRYSMKFGGKELFYISGHTRCLNINIEIPSSLKKELSDIISKLYLYKKLTQQLFFNLSENITQLLIDYISNDMDTFKFSISLVD